MARYTGSVCRMCRREGTKLFLKGEKCFSEKCALGKRPTPPGQHGQARQRKPSEYGMQLREKQKAKFIYGVLEKPFRNYYEKAEDYYYPEMNKTKYLSIIGSALSKYFEEENITKNIVCIAMSKYLSEETS